MTFSNACLYSLLPAFEWHSSTSSSILLIMFRSEHFSSFINHKPNLKLGDWPLIIVVEWC